MPQGFVIAQISDSHLFADTHELFHGHNVYQNLRHILKAIKADYVVDAIIFTGDLSQDHSLESYQNFVKAVKEINITKPIYFIEGNHDQTSLLQSELNGDPFVADKTITTDAWEFYLLNSQTDTPAGKISSDSLHMLAVQEDNTRHQFIFMHHNPVNVHYFIDKHALENQDEFWQQAQKNTNLKGVACGHVHREITIGAYKAQNTVPVYTCPATSIQFDPMNDGVSALDERPGYRRFIFFSSGEVVTQVYRV